MESKERKPDRRQIRTRRRIRETFMALIMEKPMEKITIKELADQADIDRKTFYLHYSTLDQVLEEIQDDLTNKIAAVISEIDLFDPSFEAMDLFQGINSILGEDTDLYRKMLMAGRYRFFYGRLKDSIKDNLRQKYLPQLKNSHISLVKLDLYSEYVTAGILGIYVEWLKHPEFDLEEVAEAATQICYGGGQIVLESIRQETAG